MPPSQSKVKPTGAQRPLLGLIGEKIGRSLTPAMQEAAGRTLGLDIRYHLIDAHVLGYGVDDIPHILSSLGLLGFTGINVTHPFKQAVLPWLDSVETTAQRVGAVNTIVLQDKKLIGYNTDYSGFIVGWQRSFGDRKPGVAVVLGAGGVGCAVAHGLVSLGARELRIVDTQPARARALSEALRAAAPLVRVVALDAAAAPIGADGVVNATPIGMYAYPGNPVPATTLKGISWATDAIYTPMDTEFILAARHAGAAVMTGQELAIGQAVDAFALFFDQPAPQAVMRAAFLDNIEIQITPDASPIKPIRN